MGLNRLEQYAGPLSFLVITGGGGVIAIWPDVKLVGYAMMALGPIPLIWIVVRHFNEWQKRKKRHPSRSSMCFVYPNIAANDDSKLSLFRESVAYFPSGEKITDALTRHAYHVAIQNLTDRTLRNVRLMIQSISPPDRPIEISCIAKRTGEVTIDIQPGAHELFLLGVGFEHRTMAGGATIRQSTEIQVLADNARHIGFWLGGTEGSPWPLLRNNGYEFAIAAYADDAASIEAMVELDAKDVLRLQFRPGFAVRDVKSSD